MKLKSYSTLSLKLTSLWSAMKTKWSAMLVGITFTLLTKIENGLRASAAPENTTDVSSANTLSLGSIDSSTDAEKTK